MVTRNNQTATKRTTPMFATMPLPLEPFSVRIPVAVHLTGIGRSKLYELIAARDRLSRSILASHSSATA